MPRKARFERVSGQHYVWLLGIRKGVYYADGRSNKINLGRHSLKTRSRPIALLAISQLDLDIAVRNGICPIPAQNLRKPPITLKEGMDCYLEYAARPVIQGGVTPRSKKRYRTVLDKFVAFASKQGIRFWQEVKKEVLMKYGAWLDASDYHDKTQYTELTVLKTVIKWMVLEGLLEETAMVRLPLKKPIGTNTYCYTAEQVQAIIQTLECQPSLRWLYEVIVALVTTGLRIGELADLRWGDINLEGGLIRLEDSTRRSRRSERSNARQTKSHRDRSLPMHDQLKRVLATISRAEDGRVFHGPRGGILKPDTVRNIFKAEVLENLGERFPKNADYRGIKAGRLHSFRHYFCSTSANQGVPEQVLMSWLGHADSQMIRHYYHLQQEQSKSHMQRLTLINQQENVDQKKC